MKAKAKSILGVVVALLVGYLVGAFLGLPTTSGVGQGNISKVSKFHMSSVSPAMSAFQERIQNDSTEMAKAALSLTVLSSRMNEFSELVSIAVEVADNNKELESEVEALKTVQRIADNAVNAGKIALNSFDDVASGAKNNSVSEYEQASQNLTVAYLMVDRQVQVGKQFVTAVDKYLKDKSIEDNITLATVRDLWASYCAGSAVLNSDKEELKYWENQNNKLSYEQISSSLDSLNNSKLISSLQVDYVLGLTNEGVLSDAIAESISNQVTTLSNAGKETISNTGKETISNTGIETISNTGKETISNTGKETISNTGIETISNTGKETISNTGIETISNTGKETISNSIVTEIISNFPNSLGANVIVLQQIDVSEISDNIKDLGNVPVLGLTNNFAN